MFKLFKKKDKTLARLKGLASVFGIIERLIKSDLLFWDRRHRRLFIAAPIATIYMGQGADAWTAFLNNIYLYVSYTYQQEQWNMLITRRQQRAVVKARKENPALSQMDIERINRTVAADMAQTEIETPPLEAFEFYVVADTRDAKAQTTIVGSYDPDTQLFNMVSWEEIRKALLATENPT